VKGLPLHYSWTSGKTDDIVLMANVIELDHFQEVIDFLGAKI
jgi:hypothetical protein